MSKFVKTEADGSLKINIKKNIFQRIHKSRAWFTNRYVGGLMMMGLAVSDVAGFWQIAEETMYASALVRAFIIVGFSAAFELAPLYIGYSISLKSYGLGEKIHNKILGFSIAAFVLGILLNGTYRFMTKNIVYTDILSTGDIQIETVALPATILLSILPLITSLVNIVIGCLAFDPLYFDLIRIKKRLSILQEKRAKLEVCIAEMNEDNEQERFRMEESDREFESAKKQLDVAKSRLRSYAKIISST